MFSVTSNVQWALAGVYGMLVVASFTVWLLSRINPDKDYRELDLRVKSWWVMVIIFSIAMVLSRTVSIIFMGLVSFLALKEYLSLIPTRRADRRVLLWIYLAVPLQYYWIADEWYGMFIVFVPIYMFLAVPMLMVLIGHTQGYLRAAGTLHWGLMTTVFSLGHAAYLLVLPVENNPVGGGAGLLLFLVPILAWFTLNIIGIIGIDRDARAKGADPLLAPGAALDRGEILLLFPEGSRGEPEELVEFKKGISYLAERYPEVPVIPCFMHGLGRSLPKGAALPVPLFLDVFVGEALFWVDNRDDYMKELRARVQALAEEDHFPEWY